MDETEIRKREQAAIKVIHAAYGTEDDEYGGTLFVSHHLEELEPEYWEKHLGTSNPDPKQVLSLLYLREHWEDDTIFDFTLPGEVTDYAISVTFGEDGEVESIAMES